MNRWWDDASQSLQVLSIVDDSDKAQGVGTALLGYHGLQASVIRKMSFRTLVDVVDVLNAMDGVDLLPVAKSLSVVLKSDEDAADVVARHHIQAKNGVSTAINALRMNGVPMPHAIERVAEVVGVPRERLGRYIHQMKGVVAPIVRQDAADRVLMDYVASASGSTGEEVSKSLQGAFLQEFNAEHPREATGRFATKASETPPVNAKQLRRERRMRRAKRQERAQRAIGQQRMAEQNIQRGLEDLLNMSFAGQEQARPQVARGVVARGEVARGEVRDTPTVAKPKKESDKTVLVRAESLKQHLKWAGAARPKKIVEPRNVPERFATSADYDYLTTERVGLIAIDKDDLRDLMSTGSFTGRDLHKFAHGNLNTPEYVRDNGGDFLSNVTDKSNVVLLQANDLKVIDGTPGKSEGFAIPNDIHFTVSPPFEDNEDFYQNRASSMDVTVKTPRGTENTLSFPVISFSEIMGEIGKNLMGEQLLAFNEEHPRNNDGRFANKEVVKPPIDAKKLRRMRRQKRAARASRAQAREATAAVNTSERINAEVNEMLSSILNQPAEAQRPQVARGMVARGMVARGEVAEPKKVSASRAEVKKPSAKPKKEKAPVKAAVIPQQSQASRDAMIAEWRATKVMGLEASLMSEEDLREMFNVTIWEATESTQAGFLQPRAFKRFLNHERQRSDLDVKRAVKKVMDTSLLEVKNLKDVTSPEMRERIYTNYVYETDAFNVAAELNEEMKALYGDEFQVGVVRIHGDGGHVYAPRVFKDAPGAVDSEEASVMVVWDEDSKSAAEAGQPVRFTTTVGRLSEYADANNVPLEALNDGNYLDPLVTIVRVVPYEFDHDPQANTAHEVYLAERVADQAQEILDDLRSQYDVAQERWDAVGNTLNWTEKDEKFKEEYKAKNGYVDPWGVTGRPLDASGFPLKASDWFNSEEWEANYENGLEIEERLNDALNKIRRDREEKFKDSATFLEEAKYAVESFVDDIESIANQIGITADSRDSLANSGVDVPDIRDMPSWDNLLSDANIAVESVEYDEPTDLG